MIASSPVLLVVVGAGLIGPRHAQHILENPDCELLAIIDPSPKTKSVAKSLRTNHYDNVDEFFRQLDQNSLPYPKGALVCTPNHTHATIAAKFASKGVHLLIEKPVSTSLHEARALQKHIEARDVRVLVGHHRRFNPFIVAAKENLSKVGRVIAIQGTWALKKPHSYFEASLWRTDIETGGGAVLINLVHDLDLLQYLFGPIERVFAEPLSKQREDYPNVDEGACLTLRFTNGIVGTFVCSDNVTSPFNFESGTGENPLIPFFRDLEGFYKIFGSEGTLSVPDFNLYHQSSVAATERSWAYPLEHTRLLEDQENIRKILPFDMQLKHFVDVVRGKQKPLCTIADGIQALLCVDAVLKSINTGMPQLVQKLDEIDISPDLLQDSRA